MSTTVVPAVGIAKARVTGKNDAIDKKILFPFWTHRPLGGWSYRFAAVRPSDIVLLIFGAVDLTQPTAAGIIGQLFLCFHLPGFSTGK